MSISLNWHNELWYLKRILSDYRKKPPMATPADIAKLIANMKRASQMMDRAASDATKHAAILDATEQQLNLNAETMDKLAEYEKQMAALDLGSNGGPSLTTTFPSSEENKTDTPVPVTHESSTGKGRFN